MRNNSSHGVPVSRRSAAIQWLVIVSSVLVTGSCFESTTEVCANGRRCPVGSFCAADQDLCISFRCGNGRIEGSEVCDDGNNLAGDGCSLDCRSDETCGNRIVDFAIIDALGR